MIPYSDDFWTCPKCDHFQEPRELVYHPERSMYADAAKRGLHVLGEHLDLICARCGFEQEMETADSDKGADKGASTATVARHERE